MPHVDTPGSNMTRHSNISPLGSRMELTQSRVTFLVLILCNGPLQIDFVERSSHEDLAGVRSW